MRTVARELASLVIGLVGIVMLGIGLNHVLDIGSCVSGGSYVVARPCPEGSAIWFWLPFSGVILWIVGIIVSRNFFFAPGAGQILWTVGFAGGGAALLVKVLTQPSMPPDSKLGASIVAATFLPMGLVVGIVGIVQLVRQRGGGGHGARRTKSGTRNDDPRRSTDSLREPWTRLKALNDLRSTGALTREEFSALKADLADFGPGGEREPAIERLALIRELARQRTSGALSTDEFKARKRSVLLGERVDAPKR